MSALTDRPIYTGAPPVRSELHLAYIRAFPCVVKGCRRRSEAAHIGPHGTSQRASDTCAAPICKFHHTKSDKSLHKIGRVAFDQLHHLNLLEIAIRLATPPRIRIEDGNYVVYVDDDVYVLRPVRDGIRLAVKSALSICKSSRLEAA